MFYFFSRKKEYKRCFVCFDGKRILIDTNNKTSAKSIGKGCFISFDAKRNLIDVLSVLTLKGF